MLWAIDVGNTHTVFGLWQDGAWKTHRFETSGLGTEDEIAARIIALEGRIAPYPVVVASVNPFVDENLERFSIKYTGSQAKFLRSGADAGLEVLYQPKHAVGADRVAAALGALALQSPPLITVDFGTATTFDAVDASGRYVGGAILPGPNTLMRSLSSNTAKLPEVPLELPERAIGQTTPAALQSGIVLGYMGGIRTILNEFIKELGGEPTILTTGGLGQWMVNIEPRLGAYHPNLVLDGLRLFFERIQD